MGAQFPDAGQLRRKARRNGTRADNRCRYLFADRGWKWRRASWAGGPRGLGPRARLHGHVGVLRRGATRPSRSRPSIARSSSGSPSSTRPTCTAPVTNEELVGRAIRGPPRRGRARHQVRHRPRPEDGRFRGVNGGPSTCAQACEASLRRLGVDDDRPLLPAPRRPDDADRGDRRRDGRAGARGQGALPRAVRGRARDASGARRTVHPITALQTEYSLWSRDPEDEVLPHVPRARHRLRAYSPLGPRLPHRAHHQPRGPRGRRLPAQLPRFQGENFAQNLACVDEVTAIAAARRAARRAARAGLGAGAGRRHRADPRHQAAQVPRGERGGAGRDARARRPRAHRAPCRPAPPPASATPPGRWRR